MRKGKERKAKGRNKKQRKRIRRRKGREMEKKKTKRARGKNGYSEVRFFIFLERESIISLGLRSIRPSDSFRPRRKVVLCGESNAWTLVLRSFDKLRDVGFYPTCFTPCLSVL